MKFLKKKKVGILFGGRSAEHEVSLQSAFNIVEAIDKTKYDLVLIGIDHNGCWYLYDKLDLDDGVLTDPDKLDQTGREIAVIPGDSGGQLYHIGKDKIIDDIDVIFPVLHGPFGEDGTVQGLLKIADIPFVGADVVGSAVGMDKDIMKRLLRDSGIKIADFLVFRDGESLKPDMVIKKLGLPLFVKPANLGSSVGINKVERKKDLKKAVDTAMKYDDKIIIERYIKGREIECSVLGNEDPEVSLPGEIIPKEGFYSYEAKYLDDTGAGLAVPAKFPKKIIDKLKKNAVKAFRLLGCNGMARVDFFLRGKDEIIVNEINTIPGFTKISMYPKLWEVSGIPSSELIDRLIRLGIERYKKDKKLKHDYR